MVSALLLALLLTPLCARALALRMALPSQQRVAPSLGALPKPRTAAAKGVAWDGDAQYNVRLLCRMVSQLDPTNSTREYVFSVHQMEELVRERRVQTGRRNEDSGLLPLRYAIRAGRRDVVRLLLRLGASAYASDAQGLVFSEVLRSSAPGRLQLLTDLLEGATPEHLALVHADPDREEQTQRNYAVEYWLRRASSHLLPPARLAQLRIPRLDALKYRVVGQTFALEQVLCEVASAYANAELSSKPLVMVFAGPPGHGKSETAKQLAELLAAPYLKVDCRNHAHPWEMFGAGAGYVGSDSASQLGTFMGAQQGRRSVVLLDEFDHCEPETWEAFYHIFEEGEYTLKRTGKKEGRETNTDTLDCSQTVWLLTTNKFDADIVRFNDEHAAAIAALKRGEHSFDALADLFDAFIRPRLRRFFQGGLTRRINAVVPFFCFDAEEALVVTDMYVDRLRLMYSQPPNDRRAIGLVDFDVSNFARGELSRAYFKHQLDGVSAIVREVNSKVVRDKLHLRWIRGEEGEGGQTGQLWVHAVDGAYVLGAADADALAVPPYFVRAGASGEARPAGGGSELELLERSEWRDPFGLGTVGDAELGDRSADSTASGAALEAEVGLAVYEQAPAVSEEGPGSPSAARSLVDPVDPVSYAELREERVRNVTVAVYFEDAAEPLTFRDLLPPSLSLSALLGRVCASLQLDSGASRLLIRVRDLFEGRDSEEAAAGAPSDARRAIGVERTDIVGPWMYVRNLDQSVAAALDSRLSIGGIPRSDVLEVLVEVALPASQYSKQLSWALDPALNGWREELRENDVLDARQASGEWAEAVVRRVAREFDGERSVSLVFMGEDDDEFKLRCSSPDIQPLYSKSRNWRAALSAGDAVEVRITRNHWQQCFVRAVDLELSVLHVAFHGAAVSRCVGIFSNDIRRLRRGALENSINLSSTSDSLASVLSISAQ